MNLYATVHRARPLIVMGALIVVIVFWLLADLWHP